MSMTKQQLTRLERLEQFVQRLTLGSYIAKAASKGGKILGSHHLLENGEQVLAKAATAYTDPDSLMALGEKHIADPTQMGVFASHVAGGDLNAARDLLIETKERGRVAKAVEATEQVDDVLSDRQMDVYDAKASVSELTARFGALERTLSAIETRLGQLETRPQAAAPVPVPAGPTVAKAAGKRRLTPAQEKDELLHKIDAYVSSPTHVGYLTSQLESGQLDQVRQAVAEAERAHNAERIKQERKTWR